MIELTKINGDPILVNPDQIEYIDIIPESKIIMMNGRFHIVNESKEIIMQKTIDYNRAIRQVHRVEG